eukprot:2423570-Rhodomonas_salina.2
MDQIGIAKGTRRAYQTIPQGHPCTRVLVRVEIEQQVTFGLLNPTLYQEANRKIGLFAAKLKTF